MKVKLILITVLGIYLLTACTLPFTKYAHIAIVSPTPAITVNKETKIPESYIKNPDGMQTSTPSPESAAPPIITTV